MTLEDTRALTRSIILLVRPTTNKIDVWSELYKFAYDKNDTFSSFRVTESINQLMADRDGVNDPINENLELIKYWLKINV